MPSGSSFMSSGNPYEDLLRSGLQSNEELRAQELNDQAAYRWGQIMAAMYGADTSAQSAENVQRMKGQQGLNQVEASTSGLPYGMKQLESKENLGRYQSDAALQKLLMMMQGQNARAEMGAASKQGKQLSFPDFLNTVVPRMKYPQGTDLVSEYMKMVDRFSTAQNPIRAQYMQGKMGPMGPAAQQW